MPFGVKNHHTSDETPEEPVSSLTSTNCSTRSALATTTRLERAGPRTTQRNGHSERLLSTEAVARVGGKPEVISQHYLGKAADIEAATAGATVMPDRTRHLAATRLPGLTAFETRRVVFGVERLIVVTQSEYLRAKQD